MASFRSFPLWGAVMLACASATLLASAPSQRGLVENPDTTENVALLVGVSHGLSGIDIDIRNMSEMADNPAYHFRSTTLMDDAGTVSAISSQLTHLSAAAGRSGTLMFYFSGHGNVGLLWPSDDTMKIEKIRKAIEDGRSEEGPLARLVMIYDSCHSGSLLDPVRTGFPLTQLKDEGLMSAQFADTIVDAFSAGNRSNYWNSLMVIASSRADETSLASPDGSIFTLAFKKAFKEVADANGTNADLVKKSQDYTKGHHPVARMVPESLGDEALLKE
jgi:hypothetical protein